MATASPTSLASPAYSRVRGNAELWHQRRLQFAWLVSSGLVLWLAIYGFSYYRLDLAARVASPYHAQLRPSGSIGLRLGMLGTLMFMGLFVYPIRKHWPWLNRIGKTRNWLDFHVILGIVAPVVVTFHASFKLGGMVGVAYWIMIAVAVSGFIGRYLYAQIPRAMNTAELSRKDMEALASKLASQLHDQALLTPEEMAPVLELPSHDQVKGMSIGAALWTIMRLDLTGPFKVARLRRKFLTPLGRLATLGGLFPSNHPDLEGVISACRGQHWIASKMLFLGRIHDLFHLWHIVHRPFSYSFAVLVVVHIAVAMMLGYF